MDLLPVTDQLAVVTLYLHRQEIEDDSYARMIDEDVDSNCGVMRPRWKRLEIVYCWGSGIQNLVETALQQESIEQFVFRNDNNNASLLQTMIFGPIRSVGIRYLKELVLQSTLTVPSCRTLASVLATTTTLTILRLDQCSFSGSPSEFEEVLLDGLKTNASITTIAFPNCVLQDDYLHGLIPKLPSSIKTLDLMGNCCRSKGMLSLAALLRDNSADSDRALETLNLTNQHPGEYGGSLDLRMFSFALSSNRTLKDLDLSFNMLTYEDICNLVDALGNNCSLERLNLMRNQLDDRTIDYIGRHLPRTKGLKFLNITSNRFGDNGADSLLRGLEGNVSLEQLIMPLGFAANVGIDYHLSLNQGGRRLLHAGHSTAVPRGLWPFVFERINGRQAMINGNFKASVLFFLLTQSRYHVHSP